MYIDLDVHFFFIKAPGILWPNFLILLAVMVQPGEFHANTILVTAESEQKTDL